MRNLFIYEVIRYYPNIRGDEFFNIGIRLSDSNKQSKIKFINDEHLAHIYRFPSIEKRVISSMLEQLQNSKSNLENWYGNYLKISEERTHRSCESFEEMLDTLYEDFIGYKFHKKEKQDRLELIRENTQLLIEREFKNHLRVERNDVFDFVVLDRDHVKHFSDLGSVSNKLHINKMIWQREELLLSVSNANTKFDFLNVSHSSTDVAKNILSKNDVNIVAYDNDELRYEYFKKMVS